MQTQAVDLVVVLCLLYAVLSVEAVLAALHDHGDKAVYTVERQIQCLEVGHRSLDVFDIVFGRVEVEDPDFVSGAQVGDDGGADASGASGKQNFQSIPPSVIGFVEAEIRLAYGAQD